MSVRILLIRFRGYPQPFHTAKSCNTLQHLGTPCNTTAPLTTLHSHPATQQTTMLNTCGKYIWNIYICMHIYKLIYVLDIHIYIYIHISIYIYTHIYIYVHTYIYIYIYMCVHMHIHAYMCLQSLNSGEYPQTTSRAVLSKFIDLWQQFRCLVQSHLAIEHTSNHAPTHPHNMYMYLILGTAIFILFLIPILLPLLVSSQCSSPTTSSAQDRKSCVNMYMGVCVWMRMCTCDSHPPRS